MTDYAAKLSIFVQIADRICDRILNGDYPEDERMPSVREIAMEMEVNPNTAMRSFERLQQAEIIYNKRGIGYFISPGAKDIITKIRRKEFMNETLPNIFREMALLNISFKDVEQTYKKYNNQNSKSL